MNRYVLVVDDERDTRELLARALERKGYTCRIAGTLAEANEQLDAGTRFDAIVTDVVLGNDDRGGLHLLRSIKKRELDAPVVVITAYADVEKLKFALNEGAAYLIEKPFKASELTDAIERVLAPALDGQATFERLFESVRLTEKERVVARHLLAGLNSNEIAQVESNSPKTIRQHVSQIYQKCCVSNRAEFLNLAHSQ